MSILSYYFILTMPALSVTERARPSADWSRAANSDRALTLFSPRPASM